MRVETETKEVTVYYFTRDEVDMMCRMGVWGMLNERLTADERIEIEYS